MEERITFRTALAGDEEKGESQDAQTSHDVAVVLASWRITGDSDLISERIPPFILAAGSELFFRAGCC